jgi:hypothetical protein
MTDRALVNAQQRRDGIAARINHLNQEIDDLRKELATADRFIADWHSYADWKPEIQPHGQGVVTYTQTYTQTPQAQDTAAVNKLTPKNPDRNSVGRIAWQIMTELQRPVPRQELFALLANRGLMIYGKDPEMVLSTMMWRMQEHFVRLPRFGYWKRNEPYQPAGYVPGTQIEPDGEDHAVVQNSIFDPASVEDA